MKCWSCGEKMVLKKEKHPYYLCSCGATHVDLPSDFGSMPFQGVSWTTVLKGGKAGARKKGLLEPKF